MGVKNPAESDADFDSDEKIVKNSYEKLSTWECRNYRMYFFTFNTVNKSSQLL